MERTYTISNAVKNRWKEITKTDRNEEIVKLRKEGASLEEIGEKFGISKSRVSYICKHHKAQ